VVTDPQKATNSNGENSEQCYQNNTTSDFASCRDSQV